MVEDTYQGKGIGTHLLKQLAVIGRERGIRILEADILVENSDMMKVFKDSGFVIAEEVESGVVRMVMDITLPGLIK